MCFVFNVNMFLTEGCGQKHLKATDLTCASYMLGSRDLTCKSLGGENQAFFLFDPWFLTKKLLCDKPETNVCC